MTDSTQDIAARGIAAQGIAAEPDGAPRIASLDVLRGIAILGILFMNINDMGASLWASFDDPRHLGWTTADQVAWWLREVFANGTARCMLEMLFGVGMVILTDRVSRLAGDGAMIRRYVTRNVVLLALGLTHLTVLLWPGDILHTYALAALIVFWFRHLSPRLLLFIGLSMALTQLVGGGYGYYRAIQRPAAVAAAQARQVSGQPLTKADAKVLKDDAERKANRAKDSAETRITIAKEDRARTGTATTWAAAAWGVALEMEGKGLELLFVWEAAATMLIGAALYKWGIIQGARSPRFYAGMTVIAYAIGLSLRAKDAFATMGFDHLPRIDWATEEIARLATTLGHIGLVQLLLVTMAGARMLKPFEAAGRTALSIYIAQTLICLWVLYPPFMLGLYGTQGWAGLMVTALAINMVLLTLANIWVRHFTIAPVEWAWRSLAEGRRLPFGRVSRPEAVPLPA